MKQKMTKEIKKIRKSKAEQKKRKYEKTAQRRTEEKKKRNDDEPIRKMKKTNKIHPGPSGTSNDKIKKKIYLNSNF